MAELDMTGQSWTGQGRVGHDRAELDRTGQSWTGHAELDMTG